MISVRYNELGDTGLIVSELCFGSLTMTKYQANLSLEEGADLINYAYDKGVNFIDTADLYDNYEYLKKACKIIGRENLIIASKTYAYNEKTAKEDLNYCLRSLNSDYIDLFLLHEQESIHTLRGHMEALDYLIRQKEIGKIRALGISTHKVAGAKAFNKIDFLDVLHPMINFRGLGILDGTKEEMESEISRAQARGKGIYGMKALGGGHLIKDVEKAIYYVKSLNLDSIAIGMQSNDEVDFNVSLLNQGFAADEIKNSLKNKERKLIVADYCIGCGNCVKACKHKAINIVDGQAKANNKCILCGYCANYCPEFCIKVI